MALRKWLSLLLIFTLCIPWSMAAQAEATQEISIFLNGQKIHSDVPPYLDPNANLTLVPLRVISEALGANVFWEQVSQTVTIQKQDTSLHLTVGQRQAWVNGRSVTLDAPVINRQGRVMVPLRFVSEQLGLTVQWEQATRTITLTSTDWSEPAAPPTTSTGSKTSDSLRGVWISTVYNLDWPSPDSYGNPAQQQQEYIQLLDELQQMGINAVFVQVRPAADAIYPSTLVPWSKFLTGTQGQHPGYDPLAFMIAETHKRGMQFHAWFNPFRASTDVKIDQLAANHVAKLHPEWIVIAGNKPYINPGIPEARQHIIAAIREVVNRYDVDGVHLDDYFYPTNVDFPDDATYQAYNHKSLASKADWRRDNINTFVRELSEAIDRVKPEIQFGISPFGVWRNQAVDPSGSATRAGVTTYDHMYADVRTWIQQGWIDYVAPQIYWSFAASATPYGTLVDWWANEVKGTDVKLYIGHAPYKLGTAEAGWQSAQEIIHQLTYNTRFPEVQGSIFFSAKDLRRNPLGIADALKTHFTR